MKHQIYGTNYAPPPTEFWDIMNRIEGIDIVAGKKPEMVIEQDYQFRTFRREPSFYTASVYFQRQDVVVVYEWREYYGKMEGFGEERNVRDVGKIIEEKKAERLRTRTIESVVH